MYVAFFVILLDMVGFGVMVPIMAFYALQLGAGAEISTLCMALYVIGMLISTPVLGRLSDCYGRKPILMLSMFGAIAGYIMLAFADTVLMIALSRLLGGLMAGNVAAAQAYVTDVSTPENRAKAMGLIGAALGLGFVIGPILGASLAGDDFATANLKLPALVSACLSFAALCMVMVFLKESVTTEQMRQARSEKNVGRLRAIALVAKQEILSALIVAGLLYNIAAGLAEAIFPLWASATGVASGPKSLVPLLLVAGISMVIMQAGLIGPLTRRFGEQKLVIAGAIGFAIGMVQFPLAGDAGSVVWVMLCLALQAASASLMVTSLQSLVSQCADSSNRGMVLGVFSSAGTLGRAIGTSASGFMFVAIDVHSPYLLSVALMALVVVAALSIIRRFERQQPLLPVEGDA